MSTSDQSDEQSRHHLEIVRLLDERYRLREDPDRRDDLDRTHARLRELLAISRREDVPEENGAV